MATASTCAASASATRAGKERSAHSQMTSASIRHAAETGSAWAESACVPLVIRARTVHKVRICGYICDYIHRGYQHCGYIHCGYIFFGYIHDGYIHRGYINVVIYAVVIQCGFIMW